MHDTNQGTPGEITSDQVVSRGDREVSDPVETGGAAPPAHPLDVRFWLLIVGAGGIAAMVLAQVELALFIVLAGVFAIGHMADLRPERQTAYRAVAWIVPVGAVSMFSSMAWIMIQSDLPRAAITVGLVASAVGAVFSLAAALRPVAHALARTLFGAERTSHVDRLAGRLALTGVLFCVPANVAFPIAADQMAQRGGSLVGASSLWANLIGLTILSLGGVGFRIARDLRSTVERLGLSPLRLSQLPLIAVGIVVLVLANAGAEALQKAWFPSLWASDQRINEMIAGSLTRGEALLLGFSAGIGEELVLRGALQPRLGIVATAVLFAVLHVQYSWFGMAIIALLGLILGWLRRWTSTTAAIAVHVLYDIAAVLALKS